MITTDDIQSIRSYPMQKRLSWWPDWEFTNDLLLHPERPRLTDVNIVAAADPESFETVVEIQFRVHNLTNEILYNARAYAIIIDDFGVLLTRPDTRISTVIDPLFAQENTTATIRWPQANAAQSYHLLLRLEDSHGNLLDVISGDFVLK